MKQQTEDELEEAAVQVVKDFAAVLRAITRWIESKLPQ